MARLGDVHKVIVTGANSFLGVHLVEALLQWGASEVACLVRRNEQQSAHERFLQALEENRLSSLDLSRVKVFDADLRLPQLGLSDSDYDYLDSQYGALLHNAAQVNHVLDYQTLAADNIEPLFECLRLCEGRRKKIFNFISTLSACSAIDSDGQVLEQEPAQTPPIYLRNGYNLSKWVGERILQRARAEGVWVNLYRPGNISFNSRTGVCQPQRNRLMLMLKGSLQLGQVPALELNFDLMPVDFLARFIAFHSSRYQAGHAVFNLHNPEPLSWCDYVQAFREHTPPSIWSAWRSGNASCGESIGTTRCSTYWAFTSTASATTSAISPTSSTATPAPASSAWAPATRPSRQNYCSAAASTYATSVSSDPFNPRRRSTACKYFNPIP